MTLTRRAWCARILATTAVLPLANWPMRSVLSATQQRDDREQWNSIYSASDFPYKTDHNDFLANVITSRAPGAALDIGMGRGRNALYLASQGWQVTGVDISDAGLKTAADEARKAGLTINAVLQDFSTFDVGTNRWDLIVGIYMGDMMITHAARIATALKPGGLLVIENFARDVNQPARVGGGPLGYTTNQLLTCYTMLRIRRYEDTVAVADWGQQGRSMPVVRFAAEKERL
ncbi:MAG: class I SAM-dependent methyltransferase [Vicinamibacterales bacterium]